MRNFWKFRFDIMNYSVDNILDIILNKKIKLGIKHINNNDRYYITITFNDDTTFKSWNVNKWYAWLNKGDLDGYLYQSSRPKRKTMRRLLNAIEDYYLK